MADDPESALLLTSMQESAMENELPPTPATTDDEAKSCQGTNAPKGILKKSKQTDSEAGTSFEKEGPFELPIIPVLWVAGNPCNEHFVGIVGYIRASYESLDAEASFALPEVVRERILTTTNVSAS
jgi:hypothetical protein